MSQNVLFFEDGVTLTDKQKEEISEGVAWTQNWLSARMKNGSFLDYDTFGLDAPDKKEYSKAEERLDNVQVVATEDFYGYLEKALAEDRLHLSQNIIAQFGGEQEALFALQIVNANKKQSTEQVMMNASKYIEESVIFFNPVAYEKTHSENNNTSGLKNMIIQEAAHIVQIGVSDEINKEVFQKCLQPGVNFDKQLDNEQSVYMRVREMRQALNIKPHQEFSVADVQQLRDQCKENDNHVFDRYSDEQIKDWFNYTSDVKKSVRIDRNLLRESMHADADSAFNEIGLLMKGRELIKDYYESHPGLQNASKKVLDIARRSKEELAEFIKQRYSRS